MICLLLHGCFQFLHGRSMYLSYDHRYESYLGRYFLCGDCLVYPTVKLPTEIVRYRFISIAQGVVFYFSKSTATASNKMSKKLSLFKAIGLTSLNF